MARGAVAVPRTGSALVHGRDEAYSLTHTLTYTHGFHFGEVGKDGDGDVGGGEEGGIDSSVRVYLAN